MTIQEIQAAIDAKYDTRQIVNLIADYLEDNPSGGASGIDDVLAIGQPLTDDRIIDLNGHLFRIFANGGTNVNATFQGTPDSELISFYVQDSTANGNVTSSQLLATTVTTQFYLSANFNDGTNAARIEGYADTTDSELTYTADTHNFIGGIETGGTPGVSQGPFTSITSITVLNGLVTDLQGS